MVLCAERFVPYPEEARLQKEENAAIESLEKCKEIKGRLTTAETRELATLKVLFALKFEDKEFSFYDWNCMNLGTKWGICYSELLKEHYRKNGKGRLIYTFQTAWSPCLPVIKAMSNKFPKLHFTMKYYEAGSGFKGTFICKKGKVIKNQQKDYHPQWRTARGG